MPQNPDQPPAPGERIERTEVVERTSTTDASVTRKAAPMWVWVLPLVVAAVVLAWYIFTRGEPNAPDIGDLGVEAPTITVEEEPDPIVVLPEIELEAPSAESRGATLPDEPTPPAAEQPAQTPQGQ